MTESHKERAMAKVGYIGLGLMGSAIARNLLKAGHTLVLHNRSRAIVAQLCNEYPQQALAGHSPREVAAQVDVVFTNLPDSPDVLSVALGADGIVHGAHDGLIFIDNSTIKPQTAREIADGLAAQGIAALDAPVSGGDIGARNATLSIMVGGDAAAFERALPLFNAMGKTAMHVGPSGAGQIAKACNQIIVAAQMAALSEALIMAQKAGVDPARVVQAIQGGAAQMWALDNKPPRLFAGNRAPGFKAYMQHKDLGIVLETAAAYAAPAPLTTLTHGLFSDLLSQGGRELDNSAVIAVYEALAGISLHSDSTNSDTPK
jgi:2-hydroxy-3-oxopropionate reductase